MGYKDPIKAKEYQRNYYEKNKTDLKIKMRDYYENNKAYMKSYAKRYREAHEIECAQYAQKYQKENKEKRNKYRAQDLNSLGQTKSLIRSKSNWYLKKYGQKIEGYQIHHCCTYNEPYKFIYCSKQMHKIIHSYLKQHNIDADSDHYEYIKHLLDDTVIKYNID